MDPWSAKDQSSLTSVPMRRHGCSGASLFKPLPCRGNQTGPETVRTPPIEVTKLPVYGYREQILELVEMNQIVVLQEIRGV